MTRWQRLALGIGLLAVALVLHFSLCDWSSFTSTGITVSAAGRIMGRVPLLPGVTTRYGIEPAMSVVLGLAIPLLMLTAFAFIMLGWRRSARLESGRCLRCGYDLQFKYEAGCPECGWRR